jgi:transcriptional regulator with XRE-family HTH domain
MPITALGEFLRTRRSAALPSSVGLPAGGRRRVPGLRREEVAALAGVNVDYYTRLEQGRESNPSLQMVHGLSRALQLDPDSCGHLHRLAGLDPANRTAPAAEPDSALVELLGRWPSTPALVVDDVLTVLASNDAAIAVAPALTRGANLVAVLFDDAAARDALIEWDALAGDAVARLRLGWGRPASRAAAGRIVDELSASHAAFAQLWRRNEVRTSPRSEVRTRDGLELRLHAFAVEGTANLTLLVGAPVA